MTNDDAAGRAALDFGAPMLALVLSDYGRDAALRFSALLAAAERARLRDLLPSGASFFDEHRRILLTLVGDLQFTKGPTLERYRREERPFDEGVLIGFPDGPPLDSVVARLGVMALEAMAGPLRRGVHDVMVFLPCNTLAPVSWALEACFATAESLDEMVAEAGLERWRGQGALTESVASKEVRVGFPTVPGAVISEARRQATATVAPLGTLDIAAVYAEAARRDGGAVQCLELRDGDRQIVRHAIRAAIDGRQAGRATAQGELRGLTDRLRDSDAGPPLVVEACTDLDYGIGLDSVAAYADEAIRDVYGDSTAAAQSRPK